MIVTFLVLITIFLFTVTVHEFAHGMTAYSFGDTTARDIGRLTLNPFKHIHILWTVVFPLFLIFLGLPAIGMAKPVPVNPLKMKNPRRDMIWVSLAGAAANILFASFLAALMKLTGYKILLYGIYFNLGLAIFNLIPIPPLDGSRILAGVLPAQWAYNYLRLERYGFVIVIILFWFGILWRIVIPGINLFCLILDVPRLIY